MGPIKADYPPKSAANSQCIFVFDKEVSKVLNEPSGIGWGVGDGPSPFREQIASGSSENAFIIREEVSMKIKIEIRKICKNKKNQIFVFWALKLPN